MVNSEYSENKVTSVKFFFFFLGLDHLLSLEALSLAHNLLNSDAFLTYNLHHLKKLKKMDLSRNVLIDLPESICTLTRYYFHCLHTHMELVHSEHVKHVSLQYIMPLLGKCWLDVNSEDFIFTYRGVKYIQHISDWPISTSALVV